MDTIFMNSTNSKTPKANRLTLKLQSKMDLSVRKKSVALANLSIYYSWKNISPELKNNKLIIGNEKATQEWTVPIILDLTQPKLFQNISLEQLKKTKTREKDSFWNKTKARGDNPEEVFKLYHDRVRKRTAYIIENGYYIKLPTKEIREMLGIAILWTTTINEILNYCIHLFQINLSEVC